MTGRAAIQSWMASTWQRNALSSMGRGLVAARGCRGQAVEEVMVALLQQLPAGFWSRSESFPQELAQCFLGRVVLGSKL